MAGHGSAVRWIGAGLAAAALVAPAAAHAQAVNVFYERALMSAAGQRCGLFTAPIAAALAAAKVQAHGAALKAGVAAQDLAGVETRARTKAAAQACGSRDLAVAATRVKSAFDGYSRLTMMNYPGEVAGWRAERAESQSGMVWNLSQTTRIGADRVTFGLAGKGGIQSLVAVAAFADGARPYAARVVMRDARRAPQAYLDRRGRAGALPLAARVTPRAMTSAYLAEARLPADPLMVEKGTKDAVAWRFPEAAVKTLASLDPREAIEVEFVFAGANGRDTVRRAYIEVGDFAAGRAFLAVAQR